MNKIAVARTMESSDIMITLESCNNDAIEIELNSTVEKQFGDHIRKVITETLQEMQVVGVRDTAVDKGALDCCIRARVKTAECRAYDRAYSCGVSEMKQLRRTMLYVPGNNPGIIKDAGIYPADCIMFGLEDSVALDEKNATRFLVYEALLSSDYEGKEILVRINALDTKMGMEDLEAIVRTGKAVIRLPKTETAQDVLNCEKVCSVTI